MLPREIVNIIMAFARYWSDEWEPVREHRHGDYGWVPVNDEFQDLIDLPSW